MIKSLANLTLLFLLIFGTSLHAQVSLEEVRTVLSATEKINAEKSLENIENSVLPKDILEKLKTPRKTMETFLTAMNSVKKASSSSAPFLNEAILTFNLDMIESDLKLISGRQFAEKLIFIFDRIERIDTAKIPNNEIGRRWFFRKEKISYHDENIDVEISIDKDLDGAWRFTPETINSIEAYYVSVAKNDVVAGVSLDQNKTSQLRHFFATWGQDKILFMSKSLWVGFAVIILLSFFVYFLCGKLIAWYLNRLAQRDDYQFSADQKKKIVFPIGMLAFCGVWLAGINVIELNPSAYSKLSRFFYIITSLLSIWVSLRIADLFSSHFQKSALKTSNKFDDALVPMITKSVKFLIYLIGIVLVAHALTFDVRGLLAGLGIGGIAMALAAKDTIANLFGSVTVLLDRPFQIGDYVYLDKAIEGTVEDLGFRSTRIRTPENSVVSIPNSVLANMAIDNYGERFSRRFRANLQVELSAKVENIEKFCDDLRAELKEIKILNPSNISVHINDLTNRVLLIQVTAFIMTKNNIVETEEKHRLYKLILLTAAKNNVAFVGATNTMLVQEVNSIV